VTLRLLVLQTAIVTFALTIIAQAHGETLAFDCSDKLGVYYNIRVDLNRSTVSIHYARPDLPQEIRTFPAEITATSIRWAFAGSPKVTLTASIDRTTGRYIQTYGGEARGSMTFRCTKGTAQF
jgi:hypothetical protein